MRQVAAPRVQPGALRQLVHPGIAPASRGALNLQRQGDVFAHRQGRNQIEELKDDAGIAAPQPGARAFGAKVYLRAGQRDLAAVRGVDCGDTIKQGSLTRSAWPHDRHQFTGAYLQRQVLKYGDLLRAQPVGLDEAGNFERGRR